jgi:alanine racemase
MHYRDTWVAVNLDRIQANVSRIKQHSGYEQLFAVVKANAYGHGDVEVAGAALEAGATHLSVAFLDEALKLRRAFSQVPILVMGPVRVEDLELVAEQQIDVIAHDLAWLQAAQAYRGKSVRLHLKIDSGMHRIGLQSADEFSQALTLVAQVPSLKLVGLFTHFATADGNEAFYQRQVDQVTAITAGFDLRQLECVHESNSAALLHHTKQPHTNAGRLGIAMYGLAPSTTLPLPFALEQAFSLHSKVTQVKTVKAGESVGYGATFTAEEDVRIASISIGYADGWLRYHQGRPVEIHGKTYPIVGRVCMDQLMIMVDNNVKVGDQVNLLNDVVTVDMAAKDLRTINYEIVCSISDRVPRCYYRAGKLVKERNDRFN